MIFVSLGTLPYPSEAPNPRAKSKPISLKTKACHFPILTVDGSDAVAVYRVASEAIDHARKGDGPTLIECLRPRSANPLLNMEKYLIRKGLWSEKWKRKISAGFTKKLAAALEKAQL